MSLYVDSSALLKRYIDEDDSDRAEQILESDPIWVTGRHTWVEVLRNLARLLEGRERLRLEEAFRNDWSAINIVELDRVTCERAADIARSASVRTLDALHLAAAQRIGGSGLCFVTFDLRQARGARSLGLSVLGC
jgi:hypothetical protein